MTEKLPQYAICINNAGYPASLERKKLYQIIRDGESERKGLLRIVDESGEPYYYPAKHFAPLDLPAAIVEQLTD